MARETKEILTPGGNKAVVKTYLTGGESEQIEDLFLAQSEIGEDQKVSFNFKSVIREANHKLIELMVVSLDGDEKDILKRLLDLKADDYRAVVDELNKIYRPEEQSSKKK